MLPIFAAPLLVSLLIGFTLGLAAWGLARGQNHTSRSVWSQPPNDLLIALLALAAFAIGAFLTYLLLTVAIR